MRSTLLSALTLVGACVTSSALAQNFVAGLGSHQEVPSVTSQAEGRVDITLVPTGDSVRVSGTIGNLSSAVDFSIAGGAHIHVGYAGENGPVVLPIAIDTVSDDLGFLNAVFTDATYALPDPAVEGNVDVAEAIRQGNAYVNVHTELWQGGEVRGQIHLTDLDATYDAVLYGEQQNPPVLTDGMGGVMIELTEDSLFVSGSVNVESPLMPVGGTPAHLHFGMFGQNGPVAVGLNLTVADDNLSAKLLRANNAFARSEGIVADLEGAMLARNVYVNVHSVAHPAGEVRGQVVPYNSSLYMAYVSDSELKPAPSALSVMRVLAEKPLFKDSLVISGSYSGFDAAAIAGNRPYILFQNPFGAADLALFTLTRDQRESTGGGGRLPVTVFAAGADVQLGAYTRLFAETGFTVTGAVRPYRSDFYHECKRAFSSVMTASQAVPLTDAAATGVITTEYYTNRIEASGIIRGLTGAATMMHIHDGMVGRAGGVVVPINPLAAGVSNAAVLADRTVLSLEPEEAARMRERGFYYNIHTAENPAGEVRGQIVPRANVLYHAVATAGQAVPGYGPSDATGAVLAEVFADRATFTGTFDDLSGGFNPAAAGGAHLHGNVAGRAGGILLPLVTDAEAGANEGEFFAASNSAMLSAGVLDSMLQRRLYMNVHSQTRPAGELRGQLTPLTNMVLHAKLSPDVTVPYTGMAGVSKGQGHLIGEVFDTMFTVSGSWDSLSTKLNVAASGGAHMHSGNVAMAGPIAFGLNFVADGDSTSATVPALINIRPINNDTYETLLDGDLYANVHTVGAPSGAIRGQMYLNPNPYFFGPGDITAPADGGDIDLGELDSTAVLDIVWDASEDDEGEADDDLVYFWQIYTDSTAAPVFQTMVANENSVSFTVGQLDTLLSSLGVNTGEMTTLYHRASVTDGSLVTPGEFFTVTLERRGILSNVAEIPEGSMRLVNTLAHAGGELTLDVTALDAGQLNYQIVSLTGQGSAAGRSLNHGGSAQRYTLAGTPSSAGMYVLNVSDEQGRSRSWVFVVQ